MRVLLRFCDAQLTFAGSADDLAQDVFEFFGRKDERRRIPDIILRKRDEMDLRPHLAIEALEILQQKGLRELARAVSAEIKKQDCVSIADTLLVRQGENHRR